MKYIHWFKLFWGTPNSLAEMVYDTSNAHYSIYVVSTSKILIVNKHDLKLFYNEWEHYQFSPLYNDISIPCKLNNTVVTIWWVANIKYTSIGSLKLFIGHR